MLLDSIYSPADVKKLNRAELHQLVDEIRYSGSDMKDMLATWAGGVVGVIIAEVIK